MSNNSQQIMAATMVNNLMNVKDSRWLQLEVCREFQRSKCSRSDTDCKFAHPPANVEVQNGRVTACYDSIKGRCNRDQPPCKYFHPPQHLKDQLLINGRNHLALKNALMQQIPLHPMMTGQLPAVAATHYVNLPAGHAFNPYLNPNLMSLVPADAATLAHNQQLSLIHQQTQQLLANTPKIARTDRLEAFPGMMPQNKRAAIDKSGMPVYQPAVTVSGQPGIVNSHASAYQQAAIAMQLQQPFVPLSFGHLPNVPRF